MCVYLRTKFQVSCLFLTSFRLGETVNTLKKMEQVITYVTVDLENLLLISGRKLKENNFKNDVFFDRAIYYYFYFRLSVKIFFDRAIYIYINELYLRKLYIR